MFLTLGERTDIANNVKVKENEAILFISIHVNSSLNKTSSGYEVWYLSPGYRRTVLDKSTIDDDDKNLFPILNSMLEEEYTTESIMIAKYPEYNKKLIFEVEEHQIEQIKIPDRNPLSSVRSFRLLRDHFRNHTCERRYPIL